MTVTKRLQIGLAIIVIGASSGAAVAKPPPGPIDPAIHAWFESLVRTDGLHCCGAADCRVAAPGEIRAGGSGYEVLLNGEWMPVPEMMLIHREDGPFAATIVCKSHPDEPQSVERLYCVIPYAGG